MLGDVESVNIRLFVPHCADPAVAAARSRIKADTFYASRLMQKLDFPDPVTKSFDNRHPVLELIHFTSCIKADTFYASRRHAKT